MKVFVKKKKQYVRWQQKDFHKHEKQKLVEYRKNIYKCKENPSQQRSGEQTGWYLLGILLYFKQQL